MKLDTVKHLYLEVTKFWQYSQLGQRALKYNSVNIGSSAHLHRYSITELQIKRSLWYAFIFIPFHYTNLVASHLNHPDETIQILAAMCSLIEMYFFLQIHIKFSLILSGTLVYHEGLKLMCANMSFSFNREILKPTYQVF